MIERNIVGKLENALANMPVVALLGPRQVGKTTLAFEISKKLNKQTTYLDLESDSDFNKLSDPESYFKRFNSVLIIIDEVQRKPDLFRIIRGIVDERKRNGEKNGHFLLLGSASRDLLQLSSESLAGRIRYLELTPFTFTEIEKKEGKDFNYEKNWLRGGFPDSYLNENDTQSWEWRSDFITTYVERDIPNMGVGISPEHLKRCWKMLAHYHGNQVNYSELGRSLELSHTTIKHYIDVLTDFYMVRQLQPWSGNLKKRLVKSPKIYIRDSGILHTLLRLPKMTDLLSHPSIGASWEGFVIENIINQLNDQWEISYYRTATQIEIDLVLKTPDNEIWAVEIKRASAPKLSRGFYEACKDIQATHKWIVNAQEDQYPLTNEMDVIGLREFLKQITSKNELK